MRINRALGFIILVITLKFFLSSAFSAFHSMTATAFSTAESILLVSKDHADALRR
jgi:hypothetical protein